VGVWECGGVGEKLFVFVIKITCLGSVWFFVLEFAYILEKGGYDAGC
jgi:hypothetical protein